LNVFNFKERKKVKKDKNEAKFCMRIFFFFLLIT